MENTRTGFKLTKTDPDHIVYLEKRISELEAQIEKMRNCGNCNGIVEGGIRTKKCKFCIDSKDLPRWEIKENDN